MNNLNTYKSKLKLEETFQISHNFIYSIISANQCLKQTKNHSHTKHIHTLTHLHIHTHIHIQLYKNTNICKHNHEQLNITSKHQSQFQHFLQIKFHCLFYSKLNINLYAFIHLFQINFVISLLRILCKCLKENTFLHVL